MGSYHDSSWLNESGEHGPRQEKRLNPPPLSQSELRGALLIPRSLRVSFLLWMTTAVVYLVGAIVSYAQRDATAAALRAANTALTEEQLHAAATASSTSSAAVGVAFAAVCIRCAFKLRKGRGWARITLAVATALRVVSLVINFSPLTAVGAVTAAAATILLFLPDANRYFATAKRSFGSNNLAKNGR